MKDYFVKTFDYNYDDSFYAQDTSLFKVFFMDLEDNNPIQILGLSDTQVKSFEVNDHISLSVKRLIMRQGASAITLPTPEIGSTFKFSCSYLVNQDVLKEISTLYGRYGISGHGAKFNGFGRCNILTEVHFYRNFDDTEPVKVMQYNNVNIVETSGLVFDTTANEALDITITFQSDELKFISNKESVALNPGKFNSDDLVPQNSVIEDNASTGNIDDTINFKSISQKANDLFSTESLSESFPAVPSTNITDETSNLEGFNVAANTKVGKVNEPIKDAAYKAKEVYDSLGQTLVITSGSDTTFARGSASKHYTGNALDIRTNNLKNPDGTNYTDDQKAALARQIRAELGSDYTVIFESPRNKYKSPEHIHIQYNKGTRAITRDKALELGDSRFNNHQHHHEHDGHRHI